MIIINLVSYLNRQIKFSRKTFGPGKRTQAILDHIKKEIKEVEEAPDDLEEWVDLAMLSLDGAWRAGYSAEEVAKALLNKLKKNEKRSWPNWRTSDPDKAIEHIRK